MCGIEHRALSLMASGWKNGSASAAVRPAVGPHRVRAREGALDRRPERVDVRRLVHDHAARLAPLQPLAP